MTIKLITLDLDNTLWPVDEVIRRAESVGAEWLQTEHPEVSARFDAPTLIALRQKLISENPAYLHNLTALRKAALHTAFIESGYSTADAQQASEAAFSIFHDARNHVSLFPSVRETLEVLANRYTLCALTNGNADLKKIGLDDVFTFHHSAETIGKRKPEPDMFEAALRSANVRPHESVHLGDHPLEDIQAALNHGFNAIWADLMECPWPADLPAPTYRIKHWQELPALVKKIND